MSLGTLGRMTSKPKVLVLADVPNWAWGRKAQQYERLLSDEFAVTVAYHAAIPDMRAFDLIHLFEVSQLRALPEDWGKRGRFADVIDSIDEPPVIAGLTAHVWKTWGAEQMQRWAKQVAALHANSMLLENELRQFHEHVYYTPNGVDTQFWRRYPTSETVREGDYSFARPVAFTACHVGKPNPRKGGDMIVEACRALGIPLLLCQRTSKEALIPEAVREMYRRAWVQITMSDMDGTPNPMLESAACENALISTRIGNMPEVISDFHNGFLVERDLDALTDRLAWLRDHPRACEEFGRNARRTMVDHWTWPRAAQYVRTMWSAVLRRDIRARSI